MTLEELLAMPNLATVERKRLIHLCAAEGYVICNYVEGMDMKEYGSLKCMYLPIRDSYNETYSTITDEQDAIYAAMSEEAFKKEEA